ncbi:hypothetical protein HYDPIDRAFT_42983 [Hydnomerulius pinastri MD-312]|uniref:DUF6534 domain-containing protein n=1 Tax=Hydnomerulius pinastri MD-312 TaxID=994086 RepID=A0A0C9V5R2_9AGAM|nr:hypothetical protein HYDPIDRAFT_42983 [Hydnomerulius pinastri MD-312]
MTILLSDQAELIPLIRGPLFGALFSLMLYGVSCMQTFFYFQNYRNDFLVLKLMVTVLWVLESVQAGLIIGSLNYYLVDNYSNAEKLEYICWESSILFLTGFMFGLVTNWYYSWRLWRLPCKRILPIALATFSILRFCVGVALTVTSFGGRWLWASSDYELLVKISIIIILAGDAWSAGTFAVYLYKARTGIRQSVTDRVVVHLFLFTVGTGGLTSFVEIITLITFFVAPGNLTYVGFMLIQTKLYTNAMLTSLNMRHRNSKLLNNTASKIAPLSTLVFRRSISLLSEASVILHDGLPDEHGEDRDPDDVGRGPGNKVHKAPFGPDDQV